MPYISAKRREEIAETGEFRGPGELNFLITALIVEYLHTNGSTYATLNEVVGVLECAKLELYRRKVAPYEDKKMKESGDVY